MIICLENQFLVFFFEWPLKTDFTVTLVVTCLNVACDDKGPLLCMLCPSCLWRYYHLHIFCDYINMLLRNIIIYSYYRNGLILYIHVYINHDNAYFFHKGVNLV